MAIVMRIVVFLAALMIGVSVVQMLASESGEVVVVSTFDDSGEMFRTRLWVVDHEGSQWLRAGGAGASWYLRMQANPRIRVARGDVIFDAVVHPTRKPTEVINRLMLEKYGWADQWISLLFPRDNVVPIRLEVVDTPE